MRELLNEERTANSMARPSNSVLDALEEFGRLRLTELGYDPDAPFPLRELPLLLPARGGKRLSYGSVLREVRRRRLDAAKVAREWHTTLEAVLLWLARRTWPSRGDSPTESDQRAAERAHSAAAARLAKASRTRRRTA